MTHLIIGRTLRDKQGQKITSFAVGIGFYDDFDVLREEEKCAKRGVRLFKFPANHPDPMAVVKAALVDEV